ncbi:MAG: hypothetical protein ACLVKO_04965 [Dysgonomonas sp.]
MNKKNIRYGGLGMLLLLFFVVFNSCSDDVYYLDNPIAIQLKPHTIYKNEWKWNANRGRYEAVKPFPEITGHMYDDGVLNASVFLKYDNGYEVQTPLPYIETWSDEDGNIYTETLSYDVSYQDGTIAYYIQASDLKGDDYYLTDYEIKLSFIFYV